MTDNTLERLQHLEQLRALPQRYARAIDARDFDAVAEIFHPDGRVEGVRGEQSVGDYLATMRDSPPTFETSMHVLGDPLISLDDDLVTAGLDTYAVVHQLDRIGGGDDMTLGMRYLDEATLVEGRWLVRDRRAIALWIR